MTITENILVIAIAKCQRAKMSGAVKPHTAFSPLLGPPAWHSRWINERGKPASQKPLTAEVSAKQSINQLQLQLHTTHVGAVAEETQSSSTSTCAGKVDHELPVNQSKGHTYTNPRPIHYLTHAHSRTLSCRGESLSASSTQYMWELLAGNRTAALPRHARGRWSMGLVYVCPLL